MRQRTIKVFVFFAFILLHCAGGYAADFSIDSIREIFRSESITGTFVAASLDGESVYVHNAPRSIERFSPASTFKIPNTLIALEAQIVDSKTSDFKWNGTERSIESWDEE